MSAFTKNRLEVAIRAIVVLLGFFFVYIQSFFGKLLPKLDVDYVTFGKLLLVGVFVSLPLTRRLQQNPGFLQRYWRLIGIVFLLIFTTMIVLTPTTPNLASSTTDVIFNLPANKIQTDLANLMPQSPVLVILAGNHQIYRYNAVLIDVLGTGRATLTPPYKNKDATTVHISLRRGSNNTDAVEFADELASTDTIFLLPASSILTPTTSSPTPISENTKVDAKFSLPIEKIQQSDTSNIQAGCHIALLLVENHQVYRYDATVVQVTRVSSTPTSGSSLTATPSSNSKITSISISLTDPTDQMVVDFAGQLSEVSTIYLLPLV